MVPKLHTSRVLRVPSRAFTLLELVLIILIVAVLSGIATLGYNVFVQSSYDSAAKTDSSQLVRTAELDAVTAGYNRDTFLTAVNRMRTGDQTFSLAESSTAPTEFSLGIASPAAAVALLSRSGSCVFTFALQGQGVIDQLVARSTGTDFTVNQAQVDCASSDAPDVLSEVVDGPGDPLYPVAELFNPPGTPTEFTLVCNPALGEEVNVPAEQVGDLLAAGYTLGACPATVNPYTRPAQEQALFTASSLSTGNNFNVLGDNASLYTAGTFTCANSTTIQAVMVTPGDANLTNSCSLTGLWSGGDVTLTTGGPSVPGGISAVGDVTVTNGPLNLGPVTAGGTVSANSGSSQVTEGANVPTPPDFDFPVLSFDPADWQGWDITSWQDWVSAVAAENGARGSAPSDPCSIDGRPFSMNGGLTSPANPTVVDARACPTLTWRGISGADRLTLRNDLTILVNNFTNTNGLTVLSNGEATLRIISPHTGVGECGASSGGSVTFNSGGLDLTAGGNVSTLIYAPNQVSIVNNSILKGQIFSCSASISNNFTLEFERVPFTP